jgi:hypothetical protein
VDHGVVSWVGVGRAQRSRSNIEQVQPAAENKKAPEERVVPSGADAGLPIDDVVDRKKADARRLI